MPLAMRSCWKTWLGEIFVGITGRGNELSTSGHDAASNWHPVFSPNFLEGNSLMLRQKQSRIMGYRGMLWYSTAIFVHAESLDVASN